MNKLTKAKLDTAIKSGKPQLFIILGEINNPTSFTVTSYDRRMVRGFYFTARGKFDATFHRDSVTLGK